MTEAALAQTTPHQLVQLAVEKGAAVEQLERLLQLQREWDADQAKKAYVVAMTAAKAEMPRVIRKSKRVEFSSKGGGRSYSHAELGDICLEVVPILAAHDISHHWCVEQPDNQTVQVTCRLTHAAGHSEVVTIAAPIDTSGTKNSIQAVGSAVTYLQRYTLKAACGIAEYGQDDDGRSSGKPLDARVAPAHEEQVETLQRLKAQAGEIRAEDIVIFVAKALERHHQGGLTMDMADRAIDWAQRNLGKAAVDWAKQKAEAESNEGAEEPPEEGGDVPPEAAEAFGDRGTREPGEEG